MTKPIVAIVAPISSGHLLAPALCQNYRLIGVIPKEASGTSLLDSLRSDDFLTIFYEEDYADISAMASSIEEVIHRVPDRLINGAEAGVRLYEDLALLWGSPYQNDPRSRIARRNKFFMQEAVKKHGMRSIQQVAVSTVEEAVSWCESKDFEGYVVKPLSSGGSDGVFICADADEVRLRVSNLLNTLDFFGSVNDQVLVQEAIHGTEYVVDTVSFGTTIQVTALFKYTKISSDGNILYRTMETCEPSENVALCEYAKRVVKCLGIDFGPAHSEIIIDDKGPVLIESGARLHGGQGSRLAQMCFSQPTLNQTLVAYDLVDLTDQSKDTFQDSVLLRPAIECFLSSPSNGYVTSVGGPIYSRS